MWRKARREAYTGSPLTGWVILEHKKHLGYLKSGHYMCIVSHLHVVACEIGTLYCNLDIFNWQRSSTVHVLLHS